MSYMERALALARKALGTSSPNPAVGAVLVKDGVVVGEGWTQPPGQAHAEVMALMQAGLAARGATLFVTLEPCCYQSRTPPCTKALMEAEVAEVHAATIDPNPQVNGRGMAELEEAGIQTYLGEREEEAQEMIEAHAKFINTGRPFVTVKFAMSLDGKIATRSGDSRWITGQEARRYVHQLRAASDGILVGVNTVLSDDPRLTARDDGEAALVRQPLRVVVDSHGRTPVAARLFKQPGKTLLVTAREVVEKELRWPGVEVEVEYLPAEDGSVDLAALVKLLGRRGLASLLVEGGGTITGSLFDRRLVDKVVAFIAPLIIGGKGAPSPVEGLGIERVAQALRLARVRVEHFGQDTAIIGYCEA